MDTDLSCPTCHASFSDKYVLKRHIASQHNSRSFQCETCSKTFNRRDNLRRHLRSHKTPDVIDTPTQSIRSTYTCETCQKVFARKDNLSRHMKTHDRPSVHVDNIATSTLPDEEHTTPVSNEITLATDLTELLERYHTSIDTYFKCQRVLDIFNFRLHEEQGDLREEMLDIWQNKLTTRVKINCSPGFILKHKTTNEYRYFHSSMNNDCLFDKPLLVKSQEQISRFVEKVVDFDILEWVRQRRPNTAWQIQMVTNMTFYIYKIGNMGKIGANEILPDYIKNHRGILALNKDKKHSRPYDDNLCFFRCLSVVLRCKCKPRDRCLCNLVRESHVKTLFEDYRKHTGLKVTRRQFAGIDLQDLLTVERLFNIAITVFELNPNQVGNVVWSSQTLSSSSAIRLNLNLYERHFSLIKNLQIYCKSYECETCEQMFTKLSHLKSHHCTPSEQRLHFPSTCYNPPATIFDKLEDIADIYVDHERRFYPYRITYDIETYMTQKNLPTNSERMRYNARHNLMSISVCSNVPDHEEPVCFISEGSDDVLVAKFVSYISTISNRSLELLEEEYRDVLEDIDMFVEQRLEVEEDFKEDEFSNPQTYGSRNPGKLKDKFIAHLSKIPVVGFNSQAYDLNILKGPLLAYLQMTDKILFTIKRENKLQCITTKEFKFLDILNFIAPGFTYDKYLKAFGCSAQKGFFPYEYITKLEQLNETELPPHSAFYSSLKQSNISVEEYAYCQQVWRENKMSTLADFLRWYNNLDTQPFLTAIARQSEIYRQKGIDMLKDAISLPGLAVRWKFHEVRNQVFDIPLINRKNSDLYKTIKENIVGGPSIIFHRYHEAGKTRLRELKYGAESHLCEKIAGYDANALYLWSMAQDMPTGTPIRRRADNNFRPEFGEKYGRMAWGYLEYIAHSDNIHIQHRYNGGEKRIGQHGLPVDGYCVETRTVYQFHGCLFHGHDCHLTNGIERNPIDGMTMYQLRDDTQRKEMYIESLGYNLQTIRECEWLDILEMFPEVASFVQTLNERHMSDVVAMTEQEVIDAIAHERFFGLVQCDIKVPDHLTDKFAEMPPIFKNIYVTRENLSDHMREFANEEGHLKTKQRMLIGSMFAENILLLTPLVKWYIDMGLVITKVHQIVQYKRLACFRDFAESVSNARRDGDSDPSKALLADTSKLVGNSVYGKTITNKERHKDVKYVNSERKASLKLLSPRFIGMDEIRESFYEVIMEKTKIVLDTPVCIGFSVLQYAKLRMLQFYYNCIDQFVSRKDYQYIEMDTDSAYMALSGPLDSIIKPELRRKFYSEYGDWFPQPYCKQHQQEFIECKMRSGEWQLRDCCKAQLCYDKRTPGLFKEEFAGVGIVALNSKTYYCWSTEAQKFSSKGINKKQNPLTKDQFLSVLQSKSPVSGTNKGFLKKNNAVFTYSQLRTGLTYFYAKRKVCEDGVSTLPLTI